MATKVRIDEGAYASMLDLVQSCYSTNVNGASLDIDFIKDDYWLQNTAVIENIEKRNGCWMVFLVFAHHMQPLKFIKRSITHYSCQKKAALSAYYMRRLAAKDQRGTLTVSVDKTFYSVN